MDRYAPFAVVGILLISVVWLYWLITRETASMRARLENRCTRCGYDLAGTPDRCPECGAEIDYDDNITGELDGHLLECDWPDPPVQQRTPQFSEEAITIHTTTRGQEARLLNEQLAARGYACRLETFTPVDTYTGMAVPAPTFSVKVYTEDLAAAQRYVRGLRRAVRLRHSVTAGPEVPREDRR